MIQAFLVRHHLVLFLAAIYAVYAAVLFGFADVHDPAHASRSALRLLTPLVELGLAATIYVAILGSVQRGRRVPWLIFGWVVLAAVALVYMAQIYSLYLSRNFISVLALQNSDSAAFIGSRRLMLALLVTASGIAAFITASLKASHMGATRRGRGSRWRWRTSGVIAAVLLLLFAWLLTLQGSDQRLEAGFRQSPVASLAVNLFQAWRPAGDLPPTEVATTDLECFAYAPKTASLEYPFLRRRAYAGAPQFARATNAPDQSPNVIVIFTEGLSARLIGEYGGAYPGLTPNIDRLATNAMQVTDYFNHTAATYRGLGGQLSSGFPFAGGGGKTGWIHKENQSALLGTRRRTLPDILGAAGYETVFFAPHKKNRPIIRMLDALGFDTVYTFESIKGELLKGDARDRPGTGGLDDPGVFTGLVAFLQQRARAGDETPFFAATYNIGTHAFLETSPNDENYGDGSNPVLNKVHNYDAAFGGFLRYFRASPFAENTVLIFTADHATYPEPAYRQVAGEDFKPYFVDRIPLLVRDPYHVLPSQWNAKARTSLALTPTILQLLGIESGLNAFLGTSLFEGRNFPLGMAAMGSSFYFTTSDGVFAADEVPPGARAAAECQKEVVRRYYRAEQANQLVPSILDGAVDMPSATN